MPGKTKSHHSRMASVMRTVKREIMLVGFALGIYVFYMSFALIQERMTKQGYGVEKEKLQLTGAMIFVQCAVNSFGSKILLLFSSQKGSHVPSVSYVRLAATYLGAMSSSSLALRYMNYPSQVLAKTCKMIPIMLLGAILYRKKYTATDYLCILLTTAGIALFMFKPNNSDSGENEWSGLALCFLSLTMDGLTGSYQDKVIHMWKPTAHELMFNMNLWATVMLAVYNVVSGEFMQLLDFSNRHPRMVGDLALLAFLGLLGQNFIFATIRNFGALPCSVVTTTRKFFTILASVVWYGNTITPIQWVGVVSVFSAIGLNIYSKQKAKNA